MNSYAMRFRELFTNLTQASGIYAFFIRLSVAAMLEAAESHSPGPLPAEHGFLGLTFLA